MNFDAIQLIKKAWFDQNLIYQPSASLSTISGPYPLLVEINYHYGYVCDAQGSVDQHTADLLCQQIRVPLIPEMFYSGAVSWKTKGELSENGI